ncbi:MAG: hypothetical protein HY076_00460 [Candidatus Eisenbacteria bacterium]|uniref:Glycine zipper 2TM domain-containing protein n=1 Tax=Eiseniibacteriota bacterium TaxID=2212470 RepID=A0A9D6QI01_UNCEI|nr:hypothetical protein [Candidatus Eisenbacteria bacterium]MBI3538732.1 hypothetical protein [Candidatus Eisenbacteria bacterium]
MRRAILVTSTLAAIAALLIGCGQKAQQAAQTSSDSLLSSNPSEPAAGNITPQQSYQQQQAQPPQTAPAPRPRPAVKHTSAPSAPAERPGVTVPAGTGIQITVDAQISSETAQPGDTWTGQVKEPVVIGTAAPIPAGSVVTGVISGSEPAARGSRAFLVLAVRSVTVNGKEHAISAGADSIIAGSPRARNLGAIAGGAAAGALIGKAVGGGKGALIGGLLGAGAATGAVAKTKGYQVVIKPGTEITFTVNNPVTMR